MKTPQQANLGGLWLMNPHAPHCTQTNLKGVVEQGYLDGFSPDLAAFAGWVPVLPPAWILQASQSVSLPEGYDDEDEDVVSEAVGVQILRQQRMDELPTRIGAPPGGSGPFHFVVWYDAIVKREPGILGGSFPSNPLNVQSTRNYTWSLYYGSHPDVIGIAPMEFGIYTAWWLVLCIEFDRAPSFEDPLMFGGETQLPLARYFFSHPAADPGSEVTKAPTLISGNEFRQQSRRFNPLGENVFKRYQGQNEVPGLSLSIRPYYGFPEQG